MTRPAERTLRPLHAVVAIGVALVVGGPRLAAAQARCAAGAKVSVMWRGTWYASTVKGGPNAQGQCLIGYDGFGASWDEWVGADRMRATATATTAAPASHPSAVSAGDYTCVSFVGPVTGGGHLVHTGDFSITGAAAYRSRGAAGRYAYDARTGLLRFQGGPYDGQTADYDASPRPAVHVHGPSGRRVMDCDGPAR